MERTKIQMVKFYQGVLLEGKTLQSFTPDEFLPGAVARHGRTAEIVEHGVLVKSEVMHVLVPWNNVAYVQYVEDKNIKEIKPTKSK